LAFLNPPAESLRPRTWPPCAILIALLLGPGPSAWTQETGAVPAGLSPARVQAVEAAIAAVMSAQKVPGLSVAVVTRGELRWSAGFGHADVENDVPATPETVYRLASISKPITAVAVLQLVEQGKIDLDAPVQRYVPAFPAKPWPLTTRQLLGHLGGVRHYAEGEFESTRHYASLSEALDIFRNDPLVQEPGTKYLYSTYGYTLVGAVVEAAAGTAFADYLRTNVFEPAGMAAARTDDVFDIIPRRAQGYRKGPAGALRNSGLADTSYKLPGGGLCATAPDLARFASALWKGTLVRPETRRLMFTSLKTREGKPTGYGLGWALGTGPRGRAEVFHRGDQQRVTTLLYTQPERRLAVVLFANLEGISTPLFALARQIAQIIGPGREEP
jgi:serine beta-lactamase-like protein LACTB, mitochondrial